ncbi:hypothetical protein ACFY19_03415 [Streptosporangium saharense]|uniref:Uncharacterized protein n=1 Tax=Streptosporangium saharense TaxID=1706840 RepID=A0A7W7QJM5_9ACTN|nr:hypothetical protein [Streptosporangium saharense]MBB4914845.1 hypothetical protein [Streptosporangium saharense]
MRDIRISDEVALVLTAEKVNALRTGPDPGVTQCVTCEGQADADAEPVSVLVVRHPTPGDGTIFNVLFAHAACAPSTVTDSEVVFDLAAMMERMRLIPTVSADDEGPVAAGLLMEPMFPDVEKAEAPANAYLAAFLRHGLPLLSLHDIDDLTPVRGWRAVITPGERPRLLRATITCDSAEPGRGPLIVAADAPIVVDQGWLRIVSASGAIRLYAGLLGIGRSSDRDLMTVVRAIGTAARQGNLCGGLIDAVLIGT